MCNFGGRIMSCWSSKNILPPLLAECIMNNECMHEHWETIESDRERIKRTFSFYELNKTFLWCANGRLLPWLINGKRGWANNGLQYIDALLANILISHQLQEVTTSIMKTRSNRDLSSVLKALVNDRDQFCDHPGWYFLFLCSRKRPLGQIEVGVEALSIALFPYTRTFAPLCLSSPRCTNLFESY